MYNLLLGIGVTFLSIWCLFGPAHRFNLLDQPNHRKSHLTPVPLTGGLAIGIATILFLLLVQLKAGSDLEPVSIVLLCSYPLLILGLIDDLLVISVGFRLAVQICLTALVILSSEVYVAELGAISSLAFLSEYRWLAAVFTVFCVIGAVNAANMVDGVDGLLGAVCVVTFVAISFLSTQVGHLTLMHFSLFIVGCLVAFLFFNTAMFGAKRKIFMGDGGSTLLGFLVAWMLIILSQSGSSSTVLPTISTVSAGWLFGFPILDAVSVTVGRLMRGESPFMSGRDHFHHKLLAAGFSTKQTVFAIVSIHCLMVLVGVGSNFVEIDDNLVFLAFVFVTVGFHFLSTEVLATLAPANNLPRR